MSSPHKRNYLPTDEFPSLATVVAGYNRTLIFMVVLVLLLGAGMGIWLLLPSAGKP